MSFFKKLFTKNWEPLICKPDAIIELFKECLEIDAPISELVIQYNEQKHDIGITADCSKERGFFDIDFYLDEQHFSNLDELRANGMIDGVRFVDIDTIKVLEDKESGNPRNNFLLEKREIK